MTESPEKVDEPTTFFFSSPSLPVYGGGNKKNNCEHEINNESFL